MTERADGQVTWSDLGLWSGKTCPEHSAATKGETSRQSSKRSSASQSRKPPILKCLKKAGTPGGATTMKWEDDGAWLGECMMRNTGESPNAAVESRLSQILEETPQEKYSLSAKACQGILRRAERRGKDLPEPLKTVLLMQSENAECGWNKPSVVVPAVLCLNDQGGNVMGVSHDVSGTLRAQEHGHQPSILDMSHACDVIRDCGEIAPSLQGRMGTGGNQVPLTYQMQGFGDYREGDVASSCKQRDFKDSTDLVRSVDCRNFTEGGEINGTLQAKESGGQSLNLNNTVRQNMVVRRLTPLECERLQGFPDGWTDIGDWVKTGKRGRRIKVKGSADSPRYKALGNSIALPFWDFLAKRISAQYLRPVTMGSLFDGIGGFPLVFERHNGKGTARWASEIEEFPIAVTKLRFGED